MAEGVKQFFVGFLHPRTWIAAIIGLVVAAIVGLALSGTLIDFFVYIGSLPPGLLGDLKNVALGLFVTVLYSFTSLTLGQYIPVIILVVSAVVAGLIFGLTSKKERVASKSIIGGLNIAIIYMVIAVVAYVIWTVGFSGFTALYDSIVAFLQYIPLNILFTFVVVWLVSAIIAAIVLSAKHD